MVQIKKNFLKLLFGLALAIVLTAIVYGKLPKPEGYDNFHFFIMGLILLGPIMALLVSFSYYPPSALLVIFFGIVCIITYKYTPKIFPYAAILTWLIVGALNTYRCIGV